MSSIFDVASVEIDEGLDVAFETSPSQINITQDSVAESISIDTGPGVALEVLYPGPVQVGISTESINTTMMEIATPGVQGAPGVQNLYVQQADPAIQNGWGQEQTNYVWIETI